MRAVETLTAEDLERLEDARYREMAEAHFYLSKAAGVPIKSHALSGQLYLSRSGWLLLSVPNAIGTGTFDALNEPGAELPVSETTGRYNAHISVATPDEVAKMGGPNKISERGHEFSYTLGETKEVTPENWNDVSKCWYIAVDSPDLRNFRKSYGLEPLSRGYEHHITFAIRKKKVLKNNEIAKQSSVGPPIVIDRPKGFKKTFVTANGPKEMTYPLDYGYFDGVINPQDNEGADVFVGSGGPRFGRFMKGKPGPEGIVPDEHKWFDGLTEDEYSTLKNWWEMQHDPGITSDWTDFPDRNTLLANAGWKGPPSVKAAESRDDSKLLCLENLCDLLTKEEVKTSTFRLLELLEATKQSSGELSTPSPAPVTNVSVDVNGRTGTGTASPRVFTSPSVEIDSNGRSPSVSARSRDPYVSRSWQNPPPSVAQGTRSELGTHAAYESQGPTIRRNQHAPEFARFVESVNPILANNPQALSRYQRNFNSLYGSGSYAARSRRESPIRSGLIGDPRGLPSSYSESVSRAGRDQYLRNMYRHVRPPDVYRTPNNDRHMAFFQPSEGRIHATPDVSQPSTPIRDASYPASILGHEVVHGLGADTGGTVHLWDTPTSITDSVARDEIASNASRTALVPQLLGSLGMSAATGGLPAALGTVAGQEQAVRYHAPTSYNPSGWRSYDRIPGWEPSWRHRLFGRQPIPAQVLPGPYLNANDTHAQNIRRLAHESAQRRGYFYPRNEHDTLNIYPTVSDVLPQMFRDGVER